MIETRRNMDNTTTAVPSTPPTTPPQDCDGGRGVTIACTIYN